MHRRPRWMHSSHWASVPSFWSRSSAVFASSSEAHPAVTRPRTWSSSLSSSLLQLSLSSVLPDSLSSSGSPSASSSSMFPVFWRSSISLLTCSRVARSFPSSRCSLSSAFITHPLPLPEILGCLPFLGVGSRSSSLSSGRRLLERRSGIGSGDWERGGW
ncbi:hypothetical protein DFH07DRAFT_825608 [Mycena maculata]|uniref:Uncharacterized protein n=1 Tax=Mycena maculata TaxID=230809 RepID=A0AAD7IWU9_9AGAR|nr:hypothetical protein DFH07DRAFT_825608 [Mycena maculata]